MTTNPPAGWYDDPEYLDQLRYWDGISWSEHRSPRVTPSSLPTPSGLSDIGDWLNSTFRALWERRMQMLAVLAVNVAVSLIYALVVTRLWDELAWDGERWIGVSAGRIWLTVVLTLALGLANGLWYLIACHQLYHSRLGLQPALATSLSTALRALPRSVGWFLAVMGAAVLAIVAAAILLVLNALLGVIAILGLLVGAVWALVKLAFLVPALVVPVSGRNPIEASADVSRSRFWPVLGRLGLLLVITFGISVGLSLITSPFTSANGDDLERYIVVADDELVSADIGGLIDEMDLTGPASILATMPGLVTTLVSLSAASVLFAETHQVRPEEPSGSAGV